MMQGAGRRMLLAIGLLAAAAPASCGEVDPVAKAVQLIKELMVVVTTDGEAADKAYRGYYEWCDDAAQESQFNIKTASSKKATLSANIEDLGSSIDAFGTKIEDLASKISSAEGELKQATFIRKQEAATFALGEKALVLTIDTLDRA